MSGPTPTWDARTQRKMVLGCGLVVVLFALGLLGLWALSLAFRVLGIEAGVTRYRPQLLWSAGVVMAVWLFAMGLIRVLRQPRTPPTGPATSELGPESPAVANMLAENFRATREAVSATLLDLAARGYVDIEGTKPATTICRIRKRSDAELSPYERMVLAVLRRRAIDGVVPAGALDTGTEADARDWWKAFRAHVEADAKARGLSRDLWDARTLWSLAAVGLVPGPLVGLAYFDFAPAMAAIAPAIVLLGIAGTRNRQRDTPAGLVAASGWLGVRRHLREDPAFPDLPPGAVEVWERYLAYGAALGAARGTVRTLPLAAEDDHLAWSTYGGRWREVRVRYPTLWPPAWGWRPVTAILTAVALCAAASVLLGTVLRIGWPDPEPTVPAGFVKIIRGLVVAMCIVAGVMAAWALPALVRSLSSLGSPRAVVGQLVRLRTFGKSSKSPGVHFAAIDEGRSERLRAYRIPPELWTRIRLEQYGEATAEVILPIGRLVSIEMTGPSEGLLP